MLSLGMLLRSLSLENFRNYGQKTFAFQEDTTVVIGPNGTGKTNLLEAIHFVCTGKGIREQKQEELVRMGGDEADVRAVFASDGTDTEYRIHIHTGTTTRKTYFTDKAKRSLYSYVRFTPPVVIFTPDMMPIIDGSPSERRSFFDHILSNVDAQYRKHARNYEQGMRKRNKILEKERDQQTLKESLKFWNGYLIEQADYIQKARAEFATYLNKLPELEEYAFRLDYHPNEISDSRFADYFEREYYQKRTLVGPQRDEFDVFVADRTSSEKSFIDAKKYASRGEQRLALLWLILRQISLYDTKLKQNPLLLLDDIFSELDEVNKKLVLDLIESYQTIITTTEESFVSSLKPHAHTIEL